MQTKRHLSFVVWCLVVALAVVVLPLGRAVPAHAGYITIDASDSAFTPVEFTVTAHEEYTLTIYSSKLQPVYLCVNDNSGRQNCPVNPDGTIPNGPISVNNYGTCPPPDCTPDPGQLFGTLIGKIGEHGTLFAIPEGTSYTYNPDPGGDLPPYTYTYVGNSGDDSGELYFQVNDTVRTDNSGYFQVSLTEGGSPIPVGNSTPELPSGELAGIGALTLVAATLYRRRRTRRF